MCTRRCMKTWNGWGRSGVNANCGEHCTARESIAHGLIIKAINYAIASTVAGHIWVKWKMKTRLRCRSQFKVRFFFWVENVCGLMCCVGWTEAQTFSTAVVVKFSFFFSSWNGPGWEEPGFEVDPRDSPFFPWISIELEFGPRLEVFTVFYCYQSENKFSDGKKSNLKLDGKKKAPQQFDINIIPQFFMSQWKGVERLIMAFRNVFFSPLWRFSGWKWKFLFVFFHQRKKLGVSREVKSLPSSWNGPPECGARARFLTF